MSLTPTTDRDNRGAHSGSFTDRSRAELHAAIDELLSDEPLFDREGRVDAYLTVDARHQQGMRTRSEEP